ncbi:hypothetical protein SRB5_03080 [Streptomyces sp. RB5]|uniref:Uncharacterized protein n=1 Tax=Streptomyces smaragdinus TaxID=2585196 RepID=A0A7K0C9S2_9ACTN|nr:hypothetical protein [Streptomyces smaragdinus]MQY10201.1 hypothetical protein [Streptomyces smaragdinus]
MRFTAELEEGNDFATSANFGGGGRGYLFNCLSTLPSGRIPLAALRAIPRTVHGAWSRKACIRRPMLSVNPKMLPRPNELEKASSPAANAPAPRTWPLANITTGKHDSF